MTDELSELSVAPPPTPPAVCGVVGGGRMGAGIAQMLLMAGSEVVLVERNDDEVSAAHRRVERAVGQAVDRGHAGDAESIVGRLTCVDDVHELARAGLVIEAVPEDIDLKLEVLARVSGVVDQRAIIASNTSSISLTRLAEAVPHPERVLGLHFFNPVPVSKLVEVVLGSHTSPAVQASVVTWIGLWGKSSVVVRDSPGFASSRLGVLLGVEAVRMVEEGVASVEDIDAAMTLGYGFPVGPLRLTDLVGLDVRLGIARYLEREIGSRFSPPQLMIDMVERGDLGRKSGRGFYDWGSTT